MIFEALETGKSHPKTAKELAAYFGCSQRDVTRQIEKERRMCKPICATSEKPGGYYKPENVQELEDYLKRARSRNSEQAKTIKALETSRLLVFITGEIRK